MANDFIESGETSFSILEGAIEGILIAEIESKRFRYANPAICAMFGYTSEEFLSLSVREIHPSGHLQAVIDLFESQARGEINLAATVPCKRKNGTIFWADINTSKIILNNVTCNLGFFSDITDRKTAQEGMDASQRLLASVFDAVPDLLIVIDRSFRIQYTNFKGHDLVKQTDTERDSTCYGRFKLLDSPCEDCSALPVFETGCIVEREMTNPADGRVREVRAFPIKNAAGEVLYAVEYVRDITEIRQTEENLHIKDRALASSFNAVAISDFNGKLTYVNDAFLRMWGYTAREALAINAADLASDKNEITHIIHDIKEKGFSIGESIAVRKDGSLFAIQFSASLVTGSSGEPIAMLSIFLDITERKGADEALHESEERFSKAFNTSPAPMAISEIETGRFIDVNEQTLRLLEFTREKMIGHTSYELGIWDNPEDRTRMRAQLHSKGSFREYPVRFITKSRNTLDVLWSAEIITLGCKKAILSLFLDITRRKQAEEEITREREKLKILSDNAPFGMALINKDGHFTYINARFTGLFGYDIFDIPDGRAWFRRAYPDTEYRHTVVSTWAEDLGDSRPGERKPRAFTVTCKDGTRKIIQFITSMLISGDYLMTCEDTTELRQLEAQLRQAQKTEAIGTLAGGIAHDFNNILTALMGYATLMQMKIDKSSPLQSYVDQILSASQKAADLTQSLLAFSRQQTVTLAPLDINNTIKATNKLLKRLVTEDIELRTSFTGDDTIVMADKSQMDQILFNLVANARDAMPKGGTLTIETDVAAIDSTFIRIHGLGETGRYVLIKISDTGMGMDEATREKIFDPFFTTKEVGKGTGLGLAAVYGIVKQHNGYITADSEPNQGTTFRIYLPAVTTKVDQEKGMTTPIATGKETILIAEDNEEVRRFIREALRQYGYKTIEAIDGEDAVNKFKHHSDIDLIVVDSVMPKKNGRETYEEIHEINPHVKVLFMSGYTQDIVLDKGIEEKEFDFIAKPLSLNKLLQKVREVLDR